MVGAQLAPYKLNIVAVLLVSEFIMALFFTVILYDFYGIIGYTFSIVLFFNIGPIMIFSLVILLFTLKMGNVHI